MSPEDKKKIEAVYQCGPKMAQYLDEIGVRSFAELADCDAEELAFRINIHLGRPHINSMGVKAIQNAIDAAKLDSTR